MQYQRNCDELPSDKDIRQKLVSRGVESLANDELLSVVIQTGRGSALETARYVYDAFGQSLDNVANAGLKRLRQTGGMGMQRAVALSAAVELGRRIALEKAELPEVVESNDDIVKMFRDYFSRLRHEEFWVVYLSGANTLIDRIKVSQGGVTGMTVDHKLILKRAFELLASSVILVHNHPSGLAKPSPEDIELTGRIAQAASMFDIRVLDHLIITTGECFSFHAAGMI